MTSEPRAHGELPPSVDLHLPDLLEAFGQASPQQKRLTELLNASVFDTPAPERVASRSGPIGPTKPPVNATVAKQDSLSAKRAQLLLPLVVDYANGLTQLEIARKHGMHVQTLRKRLQEAGINTRTRMVALTETELSSARAAVRDGASARAVARRLGVAHTTLQRALWRDGE